MSVFSTPISVNRNVSTRLVHTSVVAVKVTFFVKMELTAEVGNPFNFEQKRGKFFTTASYQGVIQKICHSIRGEVA